MRLLYLLAAVGVVACVGNTEPNRPDCLYRGDTIAYSVVTLGGVAIVCDWTIETTTHCYADGKVPPRYGQRDCTEGEQWPRH